MEMSSICRVISFHVKYRKNAVKSAADGFPDIRSTPPPAAARIAPVFVFCSFFTVGLRLSRLPRTALMFLRGKHLE